MDKLKKYYDMIEKQSWSFDKSQNCKIGQTWKYHLLPVVKNAIYLASIYGANKDVVEIAAIFHDYANMLDYNNSDKHHILGADLVREILTADGYDKDFIDQVARCIYNHRASVLKEKFSVEEICVADADAMTHLENVTELLLWRGYLKEDVQTANSFVKKKIEKTYAKMSDQTKALMKDKYEAIKKVLY